jgi:FkbM family methyltransferase
MGPAAKAVRVLGSELASRDKLRYLLRRPMERCRLAGGGVVRLRPGTTDARVFDEIFIERVYARALEAAPWPVRTIADLGANIGLSVVELLRRFPRARAVAVEPDAGNFALLQENLRSAGVSDRCLAMRAFVGASEGCAGLVDSGNGAWGMRMGAPAARGIPVMTLPQIAARAAMEEISLVKCDIEGSERDLFAGLAAWEPLVRCVILELHADLYPIAEFEAALDASTYEWTIQGRVSEDSPISVLGLVRGRARAFSIRRSS